MKIQKRLFPLVILAAVTGASPAVSPAGGGDCGTCGGAMTFPPGAVTVMGNLPADRASLDSAGAEIAGTLCIKNNFHPAASDDGNHVSWATRQAADTGQANTNGRIQLYTRSMDNLTPTRMVSRSQVGSPDPDGYADYPRMSASGDWIAFPSDSKRMTLQDSGEAVNYNDIFAYRESTGTVQRVSRNPVSGLGGNAASSDMPGISLDGRYIVFKSEAWNLQTNPTDPCATIPALYASGQAGQRARRVTNIYLRDRGTTPDNPADDCIQWISFGLVAGLCGQPDGPSFHPTVSANGCLVAFGSIAKNLVDPPIGSTKAQIYVHDRTTRTTTLVSESTGGGPGNGISRRSKVSADGGTIVFESGASDLVFGDANTKLDVFAYDVAAGTITRVSVDNAGNELNVGSALPEVSGSGRFVVYTRVDKTAANTYEIYVADRDPDNNGLFDGLLTRTKLSNANGGGTTDGWNSGWPLALSTDGKYTFFMSIASDLAAATDTNRLCQTCPPMCKKCTICEEGRDIYRKQIH